MAQRTIPSLDGLRALSIALVIGSHSGVGKTGQLGVEVFFVISGYLITTLLIKEWQATERINLGAFYLRRATRIMPAYFAYLVTIAALVRLGLVTGWPDPRWWPALTYTSNLFETREWLIGHSWSLSVEEQFYLTWPIAFALVGPERGKRIAVAGVLSGPLIRAALFASTRNGGITFLWNHDFVAMGCLAALLEPQWRLFRWRAFVVVPVATVALYFVFFGGLRWMFAAHMLIAMPLIATGIALTLLWCVRNAEHPVGRFLNSRAVRFVGVLSYSLYLWQEPFLTPSRQMPLLLALGGILVCALASYYGVERAGFALRRILERALEVRAPVAIAVIDRRG